MFQQFYSIIVDAVLNVIVHIAKCKVHIIHLHLCHQRSRIVQLFRPEETFFAYLSYMRCVPIALSAIDCWQPFHLEGSLSLHRSLNRLYRKKRFAVPLRKTSNNKKRACREIVAALTHFITMFFFALFAQNRTYASLCI